VGAGQSCTITVDWSHSEGVGVLSVSDNGGGSPQSVSLSGVVQRDSACGSPAFLVEPAARSAASGVQ
jgi:hypothetical protein